MVNEQRSIRSGKQLAKMHRTYRFVAGAKIGRSFLKHIVLHDRTLGQLALQLGARSRWRIKSISAKSMAVDDFKQLAL